MNSEYVLPLKDPSQILAKTRRTRGLVFCDSRTCGCLINRDFQGSYNIGLCGALHPRPKQMDRQTATGTQRRDAFVIPRRSVNVV